MTTNIEIARKIAEVNCPLSRESVHALAEIVVCKNCLLYTSDAADD